MANGYNKPRLVIEQSPWGNFLADLPGNVLSFMQLKAQMADTLAAREWQASEAEKSRQFQESQTYLANMLATERDLTTRIYNKIDEAEDYGLNVASAINSLDAVQATGNGQELVQLGADQRQQAIDSLKNVYSGLSQDISLFNKGRRVSSIIDANKDKILSGDEFLAYQDQLQETDPEFALPESFRQGAQYAITDPVSQMQELELEKAGLGIEEARLGIEQTQLGIEQTQLGIEQAKLGTEQIKLETQLAKTAESRAKAAEARAVTAETRAASEYEMSILDKYNAEQLVSMTGEHSVADYGISSYFSNLFKGLSKPEIMTLIEQTPQEYQDIVPQDVDYSDFQNAIAPKMGGIVAANLAANEDMLDVLGLTTEDVEFSSPEFQNVVAKGVLNAMSGFEQNPNYRFKSDIEITQAKVLEAQAQEAIDKDLQVSMTQAIPTVKATFADAEGRLNDDLIESIAEDTGIEEETVTGIVNSLIVQQDPTTLALMMRQSEDYQKVLNAAGLKTLASVVAAAGKSKAVSKGKYKPSKINPNLKPYLKELGIDESATRITTGQAQEIKDLVKHKKQSNQLVSRIENKHGDILSDPLSYTGSVGWAGEMPIPIPVIALELQKLSLDLLQTSTTEEADAIKARMKELEHFLDQVKKGK